MEDANVFRQLTEIFREVFDDDSIVLTPETTAADIDDWDSVAHIGLIVAIEECLKIKFRSRARVAAQRGAARWDC